MSPKVYDIRLENFTFSFLCLFSESVNIFVVFFLLVHSLDIHF